MLIRRYKKMNNKEAELAPASKKQSPKKKKPVAKKKGDQNGKHKDDHQKKATK